MPSEREYLYPGGRLAVFRPSQTSHVLHRRSVCCRTSRWLDRPVHRFVSVRSLTTARSCRPLVDALSGRSRRKSRVSACPRWRGDGLWRPRCLHFSGSLWGCEYRRYRPLFCMERRPPLESQERGPEGERVWERGRTRQRKTWLSLRFCRRRAWSFFGLGSTNGRGGIWKPLASRWSGPGGWCNAWPSRRTCSDGRHRVCRGRGIRQ